MDSHHRYFRIGDVEGTLIPPSSQRNRWFQKDSIHIPNDDRVGAIRPWSWPDAFEDVSLEDARRVQLAVAAMEDDPPRHDSQSPHWVGLVVAEMLGLDPTDEAEKTRIKALLKAWIKSRALEVVQVRDSRRGRDVKAVIAGPNTLAEGGEP